MTPKQVLDMTESEMTTILSGYEKTIAKQNDDKKKSLSSKYIKKTRLKT